MLCALAAGLLAACNPPPEADLPISDVGAAAAQPELVPTERFDRQQRSADPDPRGRLAAAGALASRARALRMRAAELDAPVVSPDARTRLRDAVGSAE